MCGFETLIFFFKYRNKPNQLKENSILVSIGNLPINGNLPIEAKGKLPFIGKLPIDTNGIPGIR